MNALNLLKSMLPIYHMRNKLTYPAIVGEHLCSTLNNQLMVYHSGVIDHGMIMMTTSIHRKKFNNVRILFYSSDASKSFTVHKNNKDIVLLLSGKDPKFNVSLADMNTDRDEYFNLSMKFNIQISYEEFKEICKLCSQINHSMVLYLR